MTPADLIALLARGACHGDKAAECETCRTREEAIALVERMAAVVEAARDVSSRDWCALTASLDALDGTATADRTKAPPERVDFAHPGHFIDADRCRLTLHTRVGRWRISTVGDWHPRGAWQQEPIGVNRLYETMVFELGADGEPVDWDERERAGYMTAAEARAGHEAMVAQYASLDALDGGDHG